jgi:precorrin-2/cobalt-factor-2 C20-methyltransferase
VDAALAGAGTVVVYKGGRHLEALVAAVERADRGTHAVLGTDLGLPTEAITRLDDRATTTEPAGARAPYFTTLIAPPARGQRGGAL